MSQAPSIEGTPMGVRVQRTRRPVLAHVSEGSRPADILAPVAENGDELQVVGLESVGSGEVAWGKGGPVAARAAGKKRLRESIASKRTCISALVSERGRPAVIPAPVAEKGDEQQDIGPESVSSSKVARGKGGPVATRVTGESKAPHRSEAL